MKGFKDLDKLSISDCCRILGIDKKDLPNILENAHFSMEQQPIVDRLKLLINRDKSTFYSCSNIEQYEMYLSLWPDGLYNHQAKDIIIKLKAAVDRKKKQRKKYVFVSAFSLMALLYLLSFSWDKYRQIKENNRIRDSIQLAQDYVRKIEEKKIADYNNLLDCICKYEYVGDFVDGIAPARDGGKSGYINLAGETIIPFKYDWTYPFYNELALVENSNYSGSLYGFINKTGDEIISIKYKIKPNSIVAKRFFREGLEPVSYQGKWGYIDNKGNVIIPFQFDGAGYFNNGLAQVRLDKRCGWINKDGEIIIPFAYSYYGSSEHFVGNLVRVCNFATRKYGYVDSKGNIIIPCIYENAEDFSMGRAAVSVEEDEFDDKWGYIDTSGNVVVPIEYYDVSHYFNESGLAFVKKWSGDDGVYVDLNGNFIKDPYSSLYNSNIHSNEYFIAYRNKKYGFRDINYNIVIPCKYDWAQDFCNGIAEVGIWKGDSLLNGYINKMGIEILKPQYNSVSYDEDYNLIRIYQNDKRGVSDMNGNIIIPITYDEIKFCKIASDKIIIRASTQNQVVIYDQYGNLLR